jgi:hypothetical protein
MTDFPDVIAIHQRETGRSNNRGWPIYAWDVRLRGGCMVRNLTTSQLVSFERFCKAAFAQIGARWSAPYRTDQSKDRWCETLNRAMKHT